MEILVFVIIVILSIYIYIKYNKKHKKKHKNSYNNSNSHYNSNSYYNSKYYYKETPTNKGKQQENCISDLLTNIPNSKVLRNLYIPYNGKTTEIDCVFICQKGVFVIESKNYSGYIYGKVDNEQWCQTIYNGKKKIKSHFLNPLLQNKTHIKCLNKIFSTNYKSVVVFSDNAKLALNISNVIYVHELLSFINNNQADTIDVDNVYNTLYPYTIITELEKKEHINNVINSKNICPYCGANLVLRKSKNGDFYGCTNFPKCKYTRNV